MKAKMKLYGLLMWLKNYGLWTTEAKMDDKCKEAWNSLFVGKNTELNQVFLLMTSYGYKLTSIAAYQSITISWKPTGPVLQPLLAGLAL